MQQLHQSPRPRLTTNHLYSLVKVVLSLSFCKFTLLSLPLMKAFFELLSSQFTELLDSIEGFRSPFEDAIEKEEAVEASELNSLLHCESATSTQGSPSTWLTFDMSLTSWPLNPHRSDMPPSQWSSKSIGISIVPGRPKVPLNQYL